MQLLVRNLVEDYDKWRQVFDADIERGADYGLRVCRIWRDHTDPNNVFFLLDVADVDRAYAFMANPESQSVGQQSGVIDGEFTFVDPQPSTPGV